MRLRKVPQDLPGRRAYYAGLRRRIRGGGAYQQYGLPSYRDKASGRGAQKDIHRPADGLPLRGANGAAECCDVRPGGPFNSKRRPGGAAALHGYGAFPDPPRLLLQPAKVQLGAEAAERPLKGAGQDSPRNAGDLGRAAIGPGRGNRNGQVRIHRRPFHNSLRPA